MLREPDLDRLRSLRDELFELGDGAKLTRQAFDRLWEQMVEAAHGHDEALEGIEASAMAYGLELSA